MADFRRWKVNFDGGGIVSRKPAAEPPGYRASGAKELEPRPSGAAQKSAEAVKRKQAALMQRAMDPAKQAGFMCFMLYMSGNTLQVFSIMMLVSCISLPLAAIVNVAKALPRDEDGELQVFLPRLTFCAIQLGQFVFAMYKLNTMGLLPTYASDWVSTLEAPSMAQHSLGGAL